MTNLPQPDRIRGVLSPVVTPFDRELRPDGQPIIPVGQLADTVGYTAWSTES